MGGEEECGGCRGAVGADVVALALTLVLKVLWVLRVIWVSLMSLANWV